MVWFLLWYLVYVECIGYLAKLTATVHCKKKARRLAPCTHFVTRKHSSIVCWDSWNKSYILKTIVATYSLINDLQVIFFSELIWVHCNFRLVTFLDVLYHARSMQLLCTLARTLALQKISFQEKNHVNYNKKHKYNYHITNRYDPIFPCF